MSSSSRFRLVVLGLSLASGAAYALACGGDGGSGTNQPDVGDGGAGSLPDAAVGPSDAQSAATTMRLAHLAPDLGQVDFCYRSAKTSSFQGPVLGDGLGVPPLPSSDAGANANEDGGAEGGIGANDLLDADIDAALDDAGVSDGGSADGGAASVGYRTVSRYLTLDASGPLTIALIAPGSTSCATPLFTADVTLDPGKLSTVAIVGLTDTDASGSALSLVAFTDDRQTEPAMTRVRMIHAALGGPGGRAASGALSVRASSSQTVTVADHVDPKKAGASSAVVPVDSLGYATLAPVPSPAQLAVGAADVGPGDMGGGPPATDASSDSWVSQPSELDLNGSTLHTGFVLTGGDQQPFEVLWCTDTSTTGALTTCTLVK